KLGQELYAFSRFQEMEDLVNRLLKKVATLKFSPDATKNESIRTQKRYELANIQMFAKFGLARAAFNDGDRAKTAQILDPLVTAVNKKDSQERSILEKNLPLGRALLSMAMRANMQQGKIEKADEALEALQKVDTEGSSGTLETFAVLIRV